MKSIFHIQLVDRPLQLHHFQAVRKLERESGEVWLQYEFEIDSDAHDVISANSTSYSARGYFHEDVLVAYAIWYKGAHNVSVLSLGFSAAMNPAQRVQFVHIVYGEIRKLNPDKRVLFEVSDSNTFAKEALQQAGFSERKRYEKPPRS